MADTLSSRELSVGSSAHEFAFTSGDFERVRTLIHSRAGIHLQPGKQAMVYSRLSRRLRDTGHTSFSQYLDFLERTPNEASEWQSFVNSLTTNLTAFFRESHHFDALSETLRSWPAGRCRIWCNAASTGEEPYSLAMTAIESAPSHTTVQIVASDIDTNVLAAARQGVYPADSRGLDDARLRRHFLRGRGAQAGFIRVKPELARLIEFRTFNLMSPQWSLGEPFDIVFCRNVMIYFDHETQRTVLGHIHRAMQPHGLLFVGHSENFTDARQLFRLRGKTIYERV